MGSEKEKEKDLQEGGEAKEKEGKAEKTDRKREIPKKKENAPSMEPVVGGARLSEDPYLRISAEADDSSDEDDAIVVDRSDLDEKWATFQIENKDFIGQLTGSGAKAKGSSAPKREAKVKKKAEIITEKELFLSFIIHAIGRNIFSQPAVKKNYKELKKKHFTQSKLLEQRSPGEPPLENPSFNKKKLSDDIFSSLEAALRISFEEHGGLDKICTREDLKDLKRIADAIADDISGLIKCRTTPKLFAKKFPELISLYDKLCQKLYETRIRKGKLKKEEKSITIPITIAEMRSQFLVSLAEHLGESTKYIKVQREILPRQFKFYVTDHAKFLADLLLSNRSQQRTERQMQQDKLRPDKNEVYWQFGAIRVDESQSLSAASFARSDFVHEPWAKAKELGYTIERGASYPALASNLAVLMENLGLTDREAAKIVRAIVTGEEREEMMAKLEGETSVETTYNQTFFATLAYLLFGTEAVRNPASFVFQQMMLDLIIAADKPFTWASALSIVPKEDKGEAVPKAKNSKKKKAEESAVQTAEDKEKAKAVAKEARKKAKKAAKERTADGGDIPMTMVGAVAAARYLHDAYNSVLHAYRYAGEAAQEKDFRLVALLIKKEARLFKAWFSASFPEHDDISDFSAKQIVGMLKGHVAKWYKFADFQMLDTEAKTPSGSLSLSAPSSSSSSSSPLSLSSSSPASRRRAVSILRGAEAEEDKVEKIEEKEKVKGKKKKNKNGNATSKNNKRKINEEEKKKNKKAKYASASRDEEAGQHEDEEIKRINVRHEVQEEDDQESKKEAVRGGIRKKEHDSEDSDKDDDRENNKEADQARIQEEEDDGIAMDQIEDEEDSVRSKERGKDENKGGKKTGKEKEVQAQAVPGWGRGASSSSTSVASSRGSQSWTRGSQGAGASSHQLLGPPGVRR